MPIPNVLCKNGLIIVCPICQKVKKHDKWIEFTLAMQIAAHQKGSAQMEIVCDSCAGQMYVI